MRGSIGLVIGVALGAGAMYLVEHPPWERRVKTVASDGPPVVVVHNDAGTTKPKKKKPRTRTAAGTSSAQGGQSPQGTDTELDEPAPVVLSAADRALEWRGEEVKLPPQTIDLAGGRDARPLDDGEIGAVIRGQAGGVTECVVAGARNTDLRATITVKLLVDGRGKVTRSRIHAPRYLFEHGLLGCAQRAVGRLQFPATGGATVVTMPVTLG